MSPQIPAKIFLFRAIFIQSQQNYRGKNSFTHWQILALLSFWNFSPWTFNEGKHLSSQREFSLLLTCSPAAVKYIINALIKQQCFD